MKKIVHKNQIVITTLAVLIAIAGYVTYDKKNADPKEEQVVTSVNANEFPPRIKNQILQLISHRIFQMEKRCAICIYAGGEQSGGDGAYQCAGTGCGLCSKGKTEP